MTPAQDDRARVVLSTAGASPEALYGAAVELREAFERAEHTVGLLSGDAPDIMVACFRAAAEQGLVAAMMDLAALYEHGGAAPWAPFPQQDARAAIALYRQAEAAGAPRASLRWVRTAYHARDAAFAAAAATRLGQLHAADPDDAAVMLLLGYFLQQGYGYPADPPAAVRFFAAAAARGDADAAFELSVSYALGAGVAPDADLGHRWTYRAAELGSARAQANLGGMYATGTGVTKDAAAAVSWYRRAGEAGNARAAFVAGVMLLTGDEGLATDIDEAAAQFRRADELGYPDVNGELAAIGLQRPRT